LVLTSFCFSALSHTIIEMQARPPDADEAPALRLPVCRAYLRVRTRTTVLADPEAFAKLATVDTGFDKNQVLLIRVDPRYASVPLDRRLPLYRELQRRLAAVPGVRSASFADITPVSGSFSNQVVHVVRYMAKSPEDSVVWINSISPGFFVTLETPFIAGRDFDAHDTLQAPLVAVVNESMANKSFGSPRDAVGKTFRQGNEISSPIQIVGVVKDAKYRSLRAEGGAIAYYPLSQLPPMRWANFLLRANGPAASLVPSVKAAVDDVNHDITLQFRTLSVQLDESLGRERLLATLSGFFGALALALAVIGLYGVTSYTSPGGAMKSAFAWRLGRSGLACSAWSSAKWRFSLWPASRSDWRPRSPARAFSPVSFIAWSPTIPRLWPRPA
jgi:hypothetical protein